MANLYCFNFVIDHVADANLLFVPPILEMMLLNEADEDTNVADNLVIVPLIVSEYVDDAAMEKAMMMMMLILPC